MTWAKIETGYLTNQKLMKLAPPAKLLHLQSILWSREQLTDGWVPDHMLPYLCAVACASSHDAEALAVHGLWEAGPGGHWIHDFLRHQDSCEDVASERERWKANKAEQRQRRRSTGVSTEDTTGDSTGESTRVSPVREEKRREVKQTPPLPPHFVEFYDAYPRKVGHKAALAAWEKATRTVAPQVILAGLHRLLPALRAKDQQYIPHPATWLNQGRWADLPDAEKLPRYT